MDDPQHPLDSGADLTVDRGARLTPGAAEALGRAAKWARYYLYITLAFLALGLLPQLSVGIIAGTSAPASAFGPSILGIVIMLAFYAYPVFKFWGFTHKTPRALAGEAPELLGEGIDNLRSTLRFIGVVFFVILGLYAVFFIGAMAIGFSAS